jgi:glycosyltransferase involved in cell wall biosynthesis
MLSIIICSRTQIISSDLSENIKDTVGCEYELIVIDNSENTYSIFEAYNLGIDKSTGDYLCFIHDDILFHTEEWGIVIQGVFSENKKIGLLGVAGAKTKTKIPSVWWNCPQEHMVMNIIQHYPDKEKERHNIGFEKESIQKAVVIDGVFMVMRKDKNICFSTEMEGFHNYDLNISFECIKNGHEVMVTNEILIEHFSMGTINKAWVDSAYKIHNLYKVNLPLSIWKNKTNKKLEVANAIRFINKCLDYKKNKMAISNWAVLFFVHPISKYHYRFWKRIIKNSLC